MLIKPRAGFLHGIGVGYPMDCNHLEAFFDLSNVIDRVLPDRNGVDRVWKKRWYETRVLPPLKGSAQSRQ